MLPILVQHLPRDRERLGVSKGHMAWFLGISRPDFRDLEAGRFNISYELYERIRHPTPQRRPCENPRLPILER